MANRGPSSKKLKAIRFFINASFTLPFWHLTGRSISVATFTDRAPLSDHPNCPTEQPHLVWTSSHTIVNYLEEFQSLLSGDYVGV